MPKDPKQIKLTVPEFMDTICHGCCSNGGSMIVNPKMSCSDRRNGTFCDCAKKIGTLICKKTSLENLTHYEES